MFTKMALQTQHDFCWGSHCLKVCTVVTFVCVTLLPMIVTSEYTTDNQEGSGMEYDVSLFPHFNEPYDQRNFGKLNIEVVQASTSSIHVKWGLTNLTYSDSTLESTVICETFHGKIVSDKLHPTVSSFRFQYLHSNTKYIVCVYLVETSKATNTSILHYNCRPVSTIPMVRSDSIVGVILSLGYIIVMGGIGYIVWYRRARKMKRKEEEEPMNIEESDEEEDDKFGHGSKKGNDARGRGGSGSGGRGGGGGGGRSGFSNYAAEGATAEADDEDENGRGGGGGADGGISGAAGKDRGSRGDCTGGCVPFNAKEEEEEEEDTVQYNAKKREISF